MTVKSPYIKKRNNFRVVGETCILFLKRKDGKTIKTLIDAKNLYIVNIARWFAWYSPCTKTYYVQANIKENNKKKVIYLHRYLMGFPENKVVDHINHDTLDNRESNLRVVSNDINNQNRKKRTLDQYKLKKSEIKYVLESQRGDYDLAEELGVSASIIWNTRHGKCYNSIYPEIKRWA